MSFIIDLVLYNPNAIPMHCVYCEPSNPQVCHLCHTSNEYVIFEAEVWELWQAPKTRECNWVEVPPVVYAKQVGEWWRNLLFLFTHLSPKRFWSDENQLGAPALHWHSLPKSLTRQLSSCACCPLVQCLVEFDPAMPFSRSHGLK